MKAIVYLLTFLTLVVSTCFVWVGYSFITGEFPHPDILKTEFPVVIHRPERPTVPLVKLVRNRPHGWVSLASISRVAIGAVLVSEDWAFYQHKGYDPNQIREAVKESWEEGELVRGASTITQQVVRNVFLTKDKNLWRKLKELYLAVRLEDSVKKSRILEIYLNIAEWGPGIYGIGPASRFYFNKPPFELSAKEGAFLAMLLPSPIRYGQSFRSKRLTSYAHHTIHAILGKMVRAHYLSPEERDQEIARPLSFEKTEERDAASVSEEPLAEERDELGVGDGSDAGTEPGSGSGE